MRVDQLPGRETKTRSPSLAEAVVLPRLRPLISPPLGGYPRGSRVSRSVLGRSALVAPLLLTSWSAFAEESPIGPDGSSAARVPSGATLEPIPQSEQIAPAAAESTQPRAQSTLGPVFVSVERDGHSVSPEAIATAIVRELEVARTSSPGAARGTFIVRVTAGRDLSVTFRGTEGNELQRVVKAPANDAQVIEVAALLAVNLSQDRSKEMLQQLQASVTKVENEPPPASTPSLENVPPNTTHPAPLPAPPTLPEAAANASFFHPLTIVRDADERRMTVEFGLLYSKIGALDGFGLNPVLLEVRHSTSGFLLGGVGTMAGDPGLATSHDVVRVGGLFNYGHGPLTGVSISGALDLERVPEGTSEGVSGAQIAGLASVVTGNAEGAQLSGAVTYARNVTGFQLAGAANVAHGQLEGMQVGGAANVATGPVDGVQLSGAANVAGHFQGIQFSGAVNLAQDMAGLQVGVVNIGKRVSGAQIGIVNIAEEVDGASIGLVTYSRKGRTQVSVWSDPTRPVNLGVRFVSGPLYAMPMVGADPTQSEAFDFGFSLGARIPVQRLYIDVEGNASNELRDSKVDESRVDLRYRAALGYEVLPWLGVFAGGGVRHEFHAKDGGPHELTPIWNVGVDLL